MPAVVRRIDPGDAVVHELTDLIGKDYATSATEDLDVAGAFLLRQTVQSQLYDTVAMEPVVVAAVAAMLMVVALIACLLPARRAAKTDPLIALSDQ